MTGCLVIGAVNASAVFVILENQEANFYDVLPCLFQSRLFSSFFMFQGFFFIGGFPIMKRTSYPTLVI
jgi:hypothetical protein